MPNLYLALAHYPVVNKRGEIIAAALTNLDLHDISRAAKTYGVKSFYVVTPLSDQQVLAKKIIAHWTGGAGAVYNPDRRSALELIKEFRGILESSMPHLLIFGTAWGLAESLISQADFVLEPIAGTTGYNHLSVRCAAAIILDRLLGPGK